jgi:hypothetical protein
MLSERPGRSVSLISLNNQELKPSFGHIDLDIVADRSGTGDQGVASGTRKTAL